MDWNNIWDQLLNELQGVGLQLLQLVRVLVRTVVIFVAARYAARWLRQRITAPRLNGHINPNLANLASNSVTVLVYLLAFALLLGSLGVQWSALVTYVSVVTVALTLSMQEVLRNMIAGVYILLERPFLVGEIVNVRTVNGSVERIDLRTTSIRSQTGELVLVPNSIIFSEVVTNKSATRATRTDFTVSGLTGNTEEILEKVRDEVMAIEGVRKPDPVVEITSAAATGITIQLRVWHNPMLSVRQPITDRLRALYPECEVTSALEPAA